MRYAFSQKFSNIFSTKLEKPGIHSLPTGRILGIYFARNERKSHVNFCHNGRKSCLHISEAERGILSCPPDRVATACTYMSKLKVEFNYSTIASTIQLLSAKGQKKAFHYQCFPENFTKRFSSVVSSNLMLILINY